MAEFVDTSRYIAAFAGSVLESRQLCEQSPQLMRCTALLDQQAPAP